MTVDSKKPDNHHQKMVRDIIIIIAITLLTLLLALFFDLSETFFQWSRLWEKYQIDELLFPLLSFSICLIWFSWRRYDETKMESISNMKLLSDNRLLIRNLTKNQEDERLFLSRELHDVFAQYLTALRTNAELVQIVISTKHSQLSTPIKNIIDNVDKLHSVTRSLLKTLRPPLLEFGVTIAIEDLVTEWQHAHQHIQCQLKFDGLEPNLSEEELLVLYRTIQEGLSNIARHTKASHVEVYLDFPTSKGQSPAILTLQLINDDTSSFNAQFNEIGLGVIGMRERATMLNGYFDISPYPPAGTKLELSFPIHQQDTI